MCSVEAWAAGQPCMGWLRFTLRPPLDVQCWAQYLWILSLSSGKYQESTWSSYLGAAMADKKQEFGFKHVELHKLLVQDPKWGSVQGHVWPPLVCSQDYAAYPVQFQWLQCTLPAKFEQECRLLSAVKHPMLFILWGYSVIHICMYTPDGQVVDPVPYSHNEMHMQFWSWGVLIVMLVDDGAPVSFHVM